MSNRTRSVRTAKKEAAFLEALRKGASITTAAHEAGLGRRTAYEWKAADPAFSAAWDAAVEEGTDLLEDEMIRRASKGTQKPVFHKGAICGYVREYSDTLLIFALKARRREKFGDAFKAEHSGPGGAPIRHDVRDVSQMTDAELQALAGDDD